METDTHLLLLGLCIGVIYIKHSDHMDNDTHLFLPCVIILFVLVLLFNIQLSFSQHQWMKALWSLSFTETPLSKLGPDHEGQRRKENNCLLSVIGLSLTGKIRV